jgi:hypothetical protein
MGRAKTKRAQKNSPSTGKAKSKRASARAPSTGGRKIVVKVTGSARAGIGSFIAVVHACRRAARDAGWTEAQVAALYERLQYGGGGRAGVLRRASRWFDIRE